MAFYTSLSVSVPCNLIVRKSINDLRQYQAKMTSLRIESFGE